MKCLEAACLLFFLSSLLTVAIAEIIGALDQVDYDYCANSTISDQDIWNYIKQNYSTKVRPVKDGNKAVVVTTSIVLERLSDIIEKERVIVLLGYLILQWFDEFLPWKNAAPYNCIEKILLPHDEVWNPDLVLMGSEDKYSLMHAPGHFVELSQTGGVTFYPGGEIRTECDLDLRYFPFDQQWCHIQFGAWYMWDGKQKLQLDPAAPIGFMLFAEGEQWALENYSAKENTVFYPSDPRGWTKVEFTFQFRRKALYYLVNIITPCTVISGVEIVIFTLPVDKVVKVHISFTSLLAYGVFQLMIIGDIPRTSENTPLLSIYIDLEMIYIGLVLVAEGLNFILLSRMHRNYPPSRWLYTFYRIAGNVLYFGDLSSSGVDVQKLEVDWSEYAEKMGRAKREGDDSSESGNSIEPLFPADKYTDPIHKQSLFKKKEVTHKAEYSHLGLMQDFESDAFDALNNKFAHSKDKPHSFMSQAWLLMAKVNSRLFVCLYIAGITLTPLLFFVVIPAVSPQQPYTPKMLHTA